MKKILGLALAALTTVFSLIPAQATTLSPAAFQVKVNLTAICTVVTPPGAGDSPPVGAGGGFCPNALGDRLDPIPSATSTEPVHSNWRNENLRVAST